MFMRLAGRRRWSLLAALLGGTLLLLGAPAPAAASTTPLQWHRVNIYDDPPNHERWSCLIDGDWRCRYDQIPEPTLGFSFNQFRAVFTGSDVTGAWECPGWFPGDICTSAATIVSGTSTVIFPRHGGTFTGDAEFILTDEGRLWFYWVDQFVCPWYPTFDEALTLPAECVFNP
jgi:hypothetical protein